MDILNNEKQEPKETLGEKLRRRVNQIAEEDKAYYRDGYQPLFDLMTSHDLTLTESEMYEIMNCVRKMDEARRDNKSTMVVRMQTPPMIFWDAISNADWNKMSDELQDEMIKIAKNKI